MSAQNQWSTYKCQTLQRCSNQKDQNFLTKGCGNLTLAQKPFFGGRGRRTPCRHSWSSVLSSCVAESGPAILVWDFASLVSSLKLRQSSFLSADKCIKNHLFLIESDRSGSGCTSPSLCDAALPVFFQEGWGARFADQRFWTHARRMPLSRWNNTELCNLWLLSLSLQGVFLNGVLMKRI